jgi:heme-degrading monooxygenase HmoA
VVSVQFKPDRVEEAARIYQDSVVPELRQMRGFEGGYVLTNAETGKGYIIGLWESREDAEAFESSSAFQEQAAKFEDVLERPPSREICEANIQV